MHMTLTAVETLLQRLLLLSTGHDFVANVECTTGTGGALAEAVACQGSHGRTDGRLV